MPRKGFTPERIIAKLRQIDVEYRKDKRPLPRQDCLASAR